MMAIDGTSMVNVKPVYSTQNEDEETVENKGVPTEITLSELSNVLNGTPPTTVSDLTLIADPTTATAEDVANKVNEVITALQGGA